MAVWKVRKSFTVDTRDGGFFVGGNLLDLTDEEAALHGHQLEAPTEADLAAGRVIMARPATPPRKILRAGGVR